MKGVAVCRKIFSLLVLAFCLLFSITEAQAEYRTISTEICNGGHATVYYAVATAGGFTGSYVDVVGWWKLKAGECQRLSYDSGDTDEVTGYEPVLSTERQFLTFNDEEGKTIRSLEFGTSIPSAFEKVNSEFCVKVDAFNIRDEYRSCPHGYYKAPFLFETPSMSWVVSRGVV